MPPSQGHTLRKNAPLTAEWIIAEFDETGYGGRMADSNEAGVKGLMLKRFEERGLIKSRATTNQAKWERIIRDCVPSEKYFADPKDYHYNILPPRRFWLRWSFIKYCLWDRIAFVHSLPFQFTVAALVNYFLHRWSYDLYTTRWFFQRFSCREYPIQVFCSVVKGIQDNTFTGLREFQMYLLQIMIFYMTRAFATLVAPVRQV
jgi:hypothetical protein